jgi:hypothetical protein
MSPNTEYLAYLFSQLFGFGGFGEITLLQDLLRDIATPALVAAILISASGLGEAASVLSATRNQKVWYAVLWGFLAALSLFLLGSQIQFLYVQF